MAAPASSEVVKEETKLKEDEGGSRECITRIWFTQELDALLFMPLRFESSNDRLSTPGPRELKISTPAH